MNSQVKSFKSIDLGRRVVKAYLWEIIIHKDQIFIQHQLDRQDLVNALKEIAAVKPEEEANLITEILEKYFTGQNNLN